MTSLRTVSSPRRVRLIPSPAVDLVPQRVLFPCSNDMGRAQIAAAWFRALAAPEKAWPILAASRVSTRLLPYLPEVLHDGGLSLASIPVQRLTADLVGSVHLVVTMGGTFARARVAGTLPGRREHWLIPSAGAAGDRQSTRDLCQLIRSRVAMLVFSAGWGRADLSRDAARVIQAHSPRREGTA